MHPLPRSDDAGAEALGAKPLLRTLSPHAARPACHEGSNWSESQQKKQYHVQLLRTRSCHEDRGYLTRKLVDALAKNNGRITLNALAECLRDGELDLQDLREHMEARPGIFRVIGEVNVDANVVAHNYLLFLRLCRNMFAVLALCSLPIVGLHWGLAPYTMNYSGDSVNDVSLVRRELNLRDLQHLCVAAWAYGAIVFFFAALWQCWVKEIRQTNNDLRRTLWFKEMPVRDAQTQQTFGLHDYDIERVKTCLEDALNFDLAALVAKADGVRDLVKERLVRVGQLTARLKRRVMANDDAGMNQLIQLLRETCVDEEGGTAVSFVERIEVALVVEPWYNTWNELRDCYSRLEVYDEHLDRNAKQPPPSLCSVAGYRRRQVTRWKVRTAARAAQLEREFTAIKLREKEMSGSVFVTFKEAKHADAILLDSAPKCCAWRREGLFTFGQRPFAAVTLRSRKAPHPDDVIWENLQSTYFERCCRFWALASILFVLMSMLVTPTNLNSLVLAMAPGSDFRASSIWLAPSHELPTLLLIIFNSGVLPTIIDLIADASRCHQKSACETMRSALNFQVLVFNVVVTPFIGLGMVLDFTSAKNSQLFAYLASQLRDLPSFVGNTFARPGINNPGVFGLRYLITAAFLSNTLMEADLVQRLFQVVGKAMALSDRGRQEAEEPWPFAWGYWYAYMLSLMMIGMCICTWVPLTLPIACILFSLKHFVDGKLLKDGTYSLGSSAEDCDFVPAVLRRWRSAAAWLWILAGLALCHYHHKLSERLGIQNVSSHRDRRACELLPVAGAVALAWSFWSSSSMTHRNELGFRHLGWRGAWRGTLKQLAQRDGRCRACLARCLARCLSCCWNRDTAKAAKRKNPVEASRLVWESLPQEMRMPPNSNANVEVRVNSKRPSRAGFALMAETSFRKTVTVAHPTGSNREPLLARHNPALRTATDEGVVVSKEQSLSVTREVSVKRW